MKLIGEIFALRTVFDSLCFAIAMIGEARDVEERREMQAKVRECIKDLETEIARFSENWISKKPVLADTQKRA